MIFRDFASRYWAAGLQVMPLRPKTKRPLLNNWQIYGTQAVPPETQQAWLDSYPDANIGLPAGPASGICFVDIDTTDPVKLAIIEETLPRSPWRRVGMKGCVLAFKYNGAKSFKILEATKPLVEFFSTSGQVVVPPSIHPDTGMPYKATADLFDVVQFLPDLDPNIETVLRTKLKLGGVKLDIEGNSRLSEMVSVGSRDTKLIKFAGAFSYDVIKGTITLKEAFDLLSDWVDVNVERAEGDNVDLDKGLQRVVEYLLRDLAKGKVLPKGWDKGLDDEVKKKLGLDVLTEENISCDFDDIQSKFLAELGEFEAGGGVNCWQIIERTLQRMARSQSISDLECDGLLDILKEHGGNHVKMASLRKGLKALKTPGIAGNSHAEIAESVIDDMKDIEMRFDQGWLWEWLGASWAKKESAEVLAHVAQRYGGLPAARRHSDHAGIIKVINALKTKPIMAAGLRGINFTNGFLTADLRLVPHEADFGATYTMPYAYNPELIDHCPRFLHFLRTAWDNDESKVQSLRQAIAVTMFGFAPKFEKCFLLHGVPHSGKSVLLDIITSLVPPEARSSLAPQQFSDKFKMADLAGKVMNIAGELPDNKMIQSDMFKKVISGQPMMVECKNKDPFAFKSNCAHWFAANNLPQTKDVSDGFVRRWLIYGFYNRVREEVKNINLAEEIIVEEREAIVAWAVEALPEVLRANRIITPPDSLSLAAEMTQAINTIKSWYNERIELKEGFSLGEATAYEDYRVWCMIKSHQKREMADFKRTMRELAGFGAFRCQSKETGEHTYIGVKLKMAGRP